MREKAVHLASCRPSPCSIACTASTSRLMGRLTAASITPRRRSTTPTETKSQMGAATLILWRWAQSRHCRMRARGIGPDTKREALEITWEARKARHGRSRGGNSFPTRSPLDITAPALFPHRTMHSKLQSPPGLSHFGACSFKNVLAFQGCNLSTYVSC